MRSAQILPEDKPNGIKQSVKVWLGPRLVARAGSVADDVRFGAQARLTGDGRRSAVYISQFKEKYVGERCVIIGNGPSLTEMDLSLVKDEYTFGLNRIYLMFDRLGFSTTFYVACNLLVLEQCAEEIQELKCPKFLSNRGRKFIDKESELSFFNIRRHPFFSKDIPDRGVWEGATVTYVALQLAFYMGFQEVILIGVDHHFESAGNPHSEVVSTGDDKDHFDPSYFGKGFRWQLPDLETSEIAYKIAKDAFETAGRRVLNATVGGKLDVFPRIDYHKLFSSP